MYTVLYVNNISMKLEVKNIVCYFSKRKKKCWHGWEWPWGIQVYSWPLNSSGFRGTKPLPGRKSTYNFKVSLVAQTVKNLPAMQETWGWEDSLEKGMVTHSSILAWRIPGTEEPDGLQSTGSQRVRQNWVTFTFSIPVISFADSTNCGWCSTVCIYWKKNPRISRPTKFQPMLFRG